MTELPPTTRPEHASLWLDREAARQARANARDLRSWNLDPRQLAEIELLLSGALAPLDGYLDGATHDQVLRTGALADGSACPWPLALDVGEAFAAATRAGETIALRDPEGLLVALLDVSDVFRPSPERLEEALFDGPPLFGAEADAGRDWIRGEHPFRLGGRLRGIEPVYHYDFAGLRLPPDELPQRIARRGWRRVLAVLTRRPLGPGEHALVERRARELEADVLLLAEAGMADAGSLRYYARMRALEAALPRFGEQAAEAAIVSLPQPLGSARERALRQLVARNHGATHVLLLDDLPDAPTDDVPEDVTAVPGGRMAHVPERGLYCLEEECDPGDAAQPCDVGTLVERLVAGERIPEWLGWPEVVEILRRAWPPRASQGFTLFLTGLSGSGKSTIARALLGRLMEEGSRRVTLLDGDIVRKNLSSELGFSREHRDLNIRRIGYVASEITKNGGVAICAPIAPYAATRRAVRDIVEQVGGFVEIHVATPLEVCEDRDRKGLYAQARAGVIKEFTGISDPYEAPRTPELRIDTTELSPDEAAQQVLLKLRALGYLGGSSHG